MGPQNRGFSLSDSASGGNHNPDAGSQSEGQSDSERDQSSRTFNGEASAPTLGRGSQPRLYTACLGICTSLRCPGIPSYTIWKLSSPRPSFKVQLNLCIFQEFLPD